jgi:Na+/melibiose symporter-like transporter
MSILGIILIVFVVMLLFGGFSGRFGGYGYGYGHGGISVLGIVLIVLVVLLLMGRI